MRCLKLEPQLNAWLCRTPNCKSRNTSQFTASKIQRSLNAVRIGLYFCWIVYFWSILGLISSKLDWSRTKEFEFQKQKRLAWNRMNAAHPSGRNAGRQPDSTVGPHAVYFQPRLSCLKHAPDFAVHTLATSMKHHATRCILLFCLVPLLMRCEGLINLSCVILKYRRAFTIQPSSCGTFEKKEKKNKDGHQSQPGGYSFVALKRPGINCITA